MRSPGPDQLKALLLVCVIYGHTYAQPQSGDLGKWIIYGWHIPMFLFLSGYMLNIPKLRARSWRELSWQYWRRMIWAWLAVSLAYNRVFDPSAYRSPLHAVDVLLLLPTWHLWYVPALVLGVVLLRLFAGSTAGRLVLAVIAVGGMFLFETPLGRHLQPAILHSHLDHRYFGYFGWLLLGVAVRHQWVGVPPVVWRVAAIAMGACGWVAGYYGHPWPGDLGFIALAAGAALSVPAMLAALSRPLPAVGTALARIGRYSLWLYLLHPFITTPFRQATTNPVFEQRAVGVLVTLAIMVVAGVLTWSWTTARAGRPERPALPSAIRGSGPQRES